MRWLKENWPPLAFILTVLLALGLIAERVEREWKEFAKEHECVKVAEMAPETFTTFGFGSNGQSVVGIGSTRAKTGWKCNDGITYWR